MFYRLKRRLHKIENKFRPKSFILMYHRITGLEIDPWDLAVSEENFEEQLKVLKKSYNVISLEQLIEDKKNNKLKKGSIAITFDDGYKDNYTAAYPILRKYQLPATFFISSAYIKNQEEFWWDKLVRLILTDMKLPKNLELKVINKYWDLHQESFDKKARFDFFMNVWGSLLQMHPTVRSRALTEIAAWSGHGKEAEFDHLPMSRTELIDMAQHPLISIGAHTNNHAALSFLDQDSQREEIQEGKLWLEKVLNKSITGFSYPNGSYNEDSISLLKEIGFEYACTTEEFRNSSYISNYKLPRFQVYNWNKENFTNSLEQW